VGKILGTYRSKIDIIADILRVTEKNPKKTQIMYQANLSYNLLQKYLAEVLNASLVTFNDEQQYYVITQKGQQFLNAYSEYSKSSKSVEKHMICINSKRKVLNELCGSE
jgi:predicted transcriptional regulator